MWAAFRCVDTCLSMRIECADGVLHTTGCRIEGNKLSVTHLTPSWDADRGSIN